MQARFVILRVLLEAGEGLVSVTPTTGSDGRPDARVRLDRSKIRSVGKPALERFLRRLQVSRGSSRLGDPSNLTLSPHPVIGKEGFLEEAVPKLEFECQGETCCEKM